MPTSIRTDLLSHLDATAPALVHQDQRWTWPEYLAEASRRSHALAAHWVGDEPRHVGILADNTPEMAFHLAAAGLGTHVLVGLNTTRRGEALLADVRRADCRVLVVEERHRDLLDGLDLDGLVVLDATTTDWGARTDLPDADPRPEDLFMLVFTSGTSGDPKAVRVTHAKITEPGRYVTTKLGITPDDVLYSAMPLFHSNGVIANWALSVVNGCTVALAGRFSASRFLDDVRRHGATYANYVGKPLAYVLATEPRPDDADNPLRIVFGNEGGEHLVRRFSERFAVPVVDGFGSSENAVVVSRNADTPPGALGLPMPGVAILDPDTGLECPPAMYDADGRVSNLDECVGEMVNTTGTGQFAGYYNDEAATAARLRDGMYWSGDLAYRDPAGNYWFAGRTADWLRVDGENLAAAPVEALLARHPDVVEVAVHAQPDDVGDLLAAALVLREGSGLDPAAFGEFLAAQPDLSPVAWPRVVRILDDLPRTATNKVVKRALGADTAARETWLREGRGRTFRRV